MKNKRMELKMIYNNSVRPQKISKFSKEKGKEHHHTLTDQDELTELFTFQKSLVCFLKVIENFS